MTNKGTKVIVCSCTSSYQDAHYGVGRRLHNGTETGKRPGWRCTVCGAEHA